MATGAGTEGETGGGYLRGSEDGPKKQERSTLVKHQNCLFPLLRPLICWCPLPVRNALTRTAFVELDPLSQNRGGKAKLLLCTGGGGKAGAVYSVHFVETMPVLSRSLMSGFKNSESPLMGVTLIW